MSKIVDNQEYFTLEEASQLYGWQSSTLYYFRSLEVLNTYRFLGDKKSYWKKSELDAAKNRPPEVTKRGPKSGAMLVTSAI